MRIIRSRSADVEGHLITFDAPAAVPVSLTTGPSSFSDINIRADRLDPDHSVGDITVSWWSGGAHCCTEARVASLIDGKWKIANLGARDGSALPEPKAGANGIPVWPMTDDAFLYAFEAYAFSSAPLRILRIVDGTVVDVSAEAQYRPWHQRDMDSHRKGCTDRSQQFRNGYCAAFVAGASRVGQFRQAWMIMLQNQDSRRLRPVSVCAVLSAGKCQQTMTFSGFPDALQWFLETRGYPVP